MPSNNNWAPVLILGNNICLLFLNSRSSQFYLVLDVVNLTSHEMLFNYTNGKNIVIEAKESCRVPVPVERCPIEKLQPESNEYYDLDGQPSN